MIRVCETCGHHMSRGYECAYWEVCAQEGVCDMWIEGTSNDALLYRIRKLEEKIQ